MGTDFEDSFGFITDALADLPCPMIKFFEGLSLFFYLAKYR